jgi:hypothetical protein
MSDFSTSRSQFIEDLDHFRRVQARLKMMTVLTPIVLVLSLLAAVFIHPLLLFLGFVPIVLLRVLSMRVGFLKCPKCGQFFFVGRPGELPSQGIARRYGNIGFGKSRECVHCGFRA